MIRYPKEKNTDYKFIEKEILSFSNIEDSILNFYNNFIDNYNKLNKKYSFTEHFDKDFVLYQIKNQYQYKQKALYCIPLGVKDIFNTIHLPTSMGSKIWAGFKAGNNARIVDEFVFNGGIVFSKTTTAEFAVHYIDNNKTINPYNIKHITGTSSAGSAVAVACGALPIALGSQTAGSIIRPASYNNVYGFKPSFGAIDRTGTLKTTDTLDTIGFIGSDLYGIRKVFLATYQKEKNYYYSHKYLEAQSIYKDKKKIRLGIISNQFKNYNNYKNYVVDDFNYFIDSISSKKINLDYLEKISYINEIHDLHEKIYNKSLGYYFEQERKNDVKLSFLMKEMIKKGDLVSNDDFIYAINKQPEIQEKFNKIFSKYDFIITPSTASAAPLVGEKEIDDTCLIWTFLGYPVINLPIFWNKKLQMPFGLQVIGPRYSDIALLDFCEELLLEIS